MTLEQLALQGKHNASNSMAAGVTAKLLDIRNESLKQSMSRFQISLIALNMLPMCMVYLTTTIPKPPQ